LRQLVRRISKVEAYLSPAGEKISGTSAAAQGSVGIAASSTGFHNGSVADCNDAETCLELILAPYLPWTISCNYQAVHAAILIGRNVILSIVSEIMS
jgi:hypothetical protein